VEGVTVQNKVYYRWIILFYFLDKLTTHFHLVQGLRMPEVIPPPSHVFMVCLVKHRGNFTFYRQQ